MIKTLLTFLAGSIAAYFLSFRLQIRYRLFIAIGILILPMLVFAVLFNYIGDKPAGRSYRYYSGPEHIDKKEKYEKKYNQLLEEARQLENKKFFDDAIKKYREAEKIDRVVVPSYYVLLDIGIAQYEAGYLNDAFETLNKYLYNVEMELRPAQEAAKIPDGGFMVSNQTAESMKSLLSNQKKAKNLIKKIQNDRKLSAQNGIK